jgi:GNAT superfamily N-acetyltransferase
MIAQERADSAEAVQLIEELEAHLAALYRPQNRHGFSVAKLLEEGVAFFVVRDEGRPAGCVGLLPVGQEYAEIKRMYVRPAFRGRGLAKGMLRHLAQFARERGIRRLRLETGIHQHAAIALYEQAGFQRIPAFGPYRDDGVSLCYEKRIAP